MENNLQYVSKETREHIENVLADDSVHYAAKTIIRDGLERDCLDAFYDVKLALDCLSSVLTDIQREAMGHAENLNL